MAKHVFRDGKTMITTLLETHSNEIKGTISCYDRLLLFGTFKAICHPEAMSYQLYENSVKLLDYEKKFANELRLSVRSQIQALAEQETIEIHHVNYNVRKEDFVKGILNSCQKKTGIVCILSAMESCLCFKVGKDANKKFLRLTWGKGKCLHYYVYILDEEYGLCYLRIPTWAPFRLQFYCNGHDWLEIQMKKQGISFSKADNCFTDISDFKKAQEIADNFDCAQLHRRLDKITADLVSIFSKWGESLQWSISQAEMATDIVFKDDLFLPVFYNELIRTATIEVKADNIYSFLGKRLTKVSAQEVATRLQTMVHGTRIKHTLGKTSLKMYDKQGVVLRIETTINDVSVFKHHREVKHRDGTSEMKHAAMKKTIYSLGALREQMLACNNRYIGFISQWKDHTQERSDLDKITRSVKDEQDRSYRGLNFFQSQDLLFLMALLKGEFQLQGFSNRLLQSHLPNWSAAKIGRVIKRFHVLKLVKKVGKTYKYYLTDLGKRVLIAALQLKERVVLPALGVA